MLRACLLRVVSLTVTDGVPCLASLLTFTLYHHFESEPLRPGKVFSGLALFAIFSGQLFVITLMINVTSQAYISVIRLRDFFMQPDIAKLTEPRQQTPSPSVPMVQLTLQRHSGHVTVPLIDIEHSQPDSIDGSEPTDADSKYAIEVFGGNFQWADTQVLFDINLRIPRGKLTMVVGVVGSGKSSLLWALLGEMNKASGIVRYAKRNSFGFVPQKAWILNSSVRDNIIFGLPFDDEKYEDIVEASGLDIDLKTFPAGDQTEIGEKGANLSGGQRQRMSIARALYADADIYLMDDPLSALDATVGGHVFNEAIMGCLINRNRTVILATHHLHFLPHAHYVIVLNQGRIFYEGELSGFSSQSSTMPLNLASELDKEPRISEPIVQKKKRLDVQRLTPLTVGLNLRVSFSAISLLSDDVEMTDSAMDLHKTQLKALSLAAGQEQEIGRLIETEEISVGTISFRYIVSYFRAATWLITTLAAVIYLTRMGVRMFSDFWLTHLIDESDRSKSSTSKGFSNSTSHTLDESNEDEASYQHYVLIYGLLILVTIILVPFGCFFLEFMALTASRNLHRQMLLQVILSPIRFFDTNPVGRIVNRLSADMNVVDEKLIIIMDAFVFCFLSVLGGVIMNSVFVPFFLIPILPILVLFVFVQRFCITSCRELQRLDCNTKSPILAHFSQTLAGLATIRAYRSEDRFRLDIFEKIDSNNVTFLFFSICQLWLGLRLDYLGAFMILAASTASISSCLIGMIDPKTVGLVIAYAIMVCSLLNWTMRHLSDIEVFFGSVERIVRYTTIESEPYDRCLGSLPPASWPSEGKIEFKSLNLEYAPDLDPVVRDFNLSIYPGTKVGICGRTGSGKSSLTLSLFRMVTISKGQILLDDVNISDVPLELLRSRLSIIPQEPVLFCGTVRFNLDPLKQKTDEEIWNVLRISQLYDTVSGLPNKLDAIVSEGGDNFSIGQRQLFCLARALLRNSKILIMDEATASVDIKTDQMIQEIVKKAFAKCTVLTIAHRLSTIKGCDLVVVLQNGVKIEEGHPDKLEKEDGPFAHMLAENQL